MRSSAATALALVAILVPSALHAQDVELLGRIHGVRPPEGYYEALRRDPGAFRFTRVWRSRTGSEGGGDGGEAEGPDAWLQRTTDVRLASATRLGRREGPVTGTFTYPVVLGLFAGSAAPYDRGSVQREFFDGPSSRHQTITEYYGEISGGRVELVGRTFEWERSRRTRSEVVGSDAGLGSDAEVGEFIVELVSGLDDRGVDWGAFDNDGPDGVPNSGDDDGYVDVLAVVHPTAGAECDRDLSKIWSHRWHLSASGSVGHSYVTETPAADGGSIRIDDYVIVPVLACAQDAGGEEDAINHIGVLAHELGHGFGLPDLYSTGTSTHSGAGNWDLMATGSWGCGGEGTDPARPCHPGAWTKQVLGWVDVDTVSAGTDLRDVALEPVEAGGRVLRVESNDGSGEYFLLEHRGDPTLFEPGLLVWHVDPGVVDRTWPGNRVNADPERPGVRLRQADGRDDLERAGGGRGDGGDPFPGSSDSRAFHAGTDPSSFTHAGRASGLTLLGISLRPKRLVFDLANRYRTVTLETEGAAADTSFFTVDGEAAGGREHAFRSAPFERHSIEAAAGDPIAEGVRRPFREWEDGSPRAREFSTRLSDTSLVASYQGRELRFAVETTGGQNGVSPGAVAIEPGTREGWVPDGTTVVVEARPRTGFRFRGWSGDFADRPNPFEIEAVEPLTAAARFEVTYSVSGNAPEVELVAAVEREVVLQVENANEPVEWRVVRGGLPAGLELDRAGRIAGAPLEDGAFPVRLRVRDDIGLRADLDLDLVVRPPPVTEATLAQPFVGGEDGPTPLQRRYMDHTGNRNGTFDVGDVRAYMQARARTPVLETPPDGGEPAPIVVPAIRLGEEPVDGGPSGGGTR